LKKGLRGDQRRPRFLRIPLDAAQMSDKPVLLWRRPFFPRSREPERARDITVQVHCNSKLTL
jgi:hypothetical protein